MVVVDVAASRVGTAVDAGFSRSGTQRISCAEVPPFVLPPADVSSEGGQLLFEIEHSIETKPKSSGRPAHVFKTNKESKADPFKSASDAVVGTLCELLKEVSFRQFSIVVNRRVLRESERDAAVALKYPSQVETSNAHDQIDDQGASIFTVGRNRVRTESSRTDRTESSTTDNPQGGCDEMHLKAPTQPCPRARKSVAARYPRAGAFELTVYDVQRQTYRVLYSKYHKHVLPTRAEDILQDLLPFMVLFAGHSNDEPLMNRITEFANSRNMIVQLSVNELREGKGTSLLLNYILVAIEDLCRSINSGDPDHLDHLMQSIPHGLRNEDVLIAERRLEHLLSIEKKVSEALSKIEQGLVTSGMESLQRAVKVAEQEGLCGTVMDDGVACLRQAQDPEEEDNDDDEPEMTSDTKQHSLDDIRPQTPVSPSTAKMVTRASTEKSLDNEHVSDDANSELAHDRHATVYESEKSLTKVGFASQSLGYSSCGSDDRRRVTREMSFTRRISGASNSGKVMKYVKKVSSRTGQLAGLEKAENEIQHQKEEIGELKDKLLAAVKDLSITFEGDPSRVAEDASNITAKRQAEMQEDTPQAFKRHNSAELVKASRRSQTDDEDGNVVSQINAELDSLLHQVRECVFQHRQESHDYKMRLHHSEMDHAEAEAESKRTAQELVEKLAEEVRMHEQTAAQSRSLEVKSTIATAVERAKAKIQTEKASRAQVACNNALKAAIKHETGYYAIVRQENLASQLFAREAFWCEVDVCDAALREQEARRAEFAVLAECELAIAQAAHDESRTRESANLWVADCEAAAERAKQEMLSCEINSCEAIARESAARHAESEAMAARHAIACEMFTIQLTENEQALADEQAFAATEADTCRHLSALLAESRGRSNEALAQELAAVDSCRTLARQMKMNEGELEAAHQRQASLEEVVKTEAAEIDAARKALSVADDELKDVRCRCQDLESFGKQQHEAVAHQLQQLQLKEAEIIANEVRCSGLVQEYHRRLSDAEQQMESLVTELSMSRTELHSEMSKSAVMKSELSRACNVEEPTQRAVHMSEQEVVDRQNLADAPQSSAGLGNANADSYNTGCGNAVQSSTHGRSMLLTGSTTQSRMETSRARSMSNEVPVSSAASQEPVRANETLRTDTLGGRQASLVLVSSIEVEPRQMETTETGEVLRAQGQALPSAEMRLGNALDARSPQSASSLHIELAAPGEAPFDVEEALESSLEEMPAPRNATSTALANASRGEAPVSELEAECAPGEAPFDTFDRHFVEQARQMRIATAEHSIGNPFGEASTGEAPWETDGLRDQSMEVLAQSVELEVSPEQEEGMQAQGDSTGEAPQTEVESQQPMRVQTAPPSMAYHSTGWAPQAEERQIQSHSSTSGQASHSTGEALQIEMLTAQTQENVAVYCGETSHSTGEAPQVEGPVEGSFLDNPVPLEGDNPTRSESHGQEQESNLHSEPEEVRLQVGSEDEEEELARKVADEQLRNLQVELEAEAGESGLKAALQEEGAGKITGEEQLHKQGETEQARLQVEAKRKLVEKIDEEQSRKQQDGLKANAEEIVLKSSVPKNASADEKAESEETRLKADVARKTAGEEVRDEQLTKQQEKVERKSEDASLSPRIALGNTPEEYSPDLKDEFEDEDAKNAAGDEKHRDRRKKVEADTKQSRFKVKAKSEIVRATDEEGRLEKQGDKVDAGSCSKNGLEEEFATQVVEEQLPRRPKVSAVATEEIVMKAESEGEVVSEVVDAVLQHQKKQAALAAEKEHEDFRAVVKSEQQDEVGQHGKNEIESASHLQGDAANVQVNSTTSKNVSKTISAKELERVEILKTVQYNDRSVQVRMCAPSELSTEYACFKVDAEVQVDSGVVAEFEKTPEKEEKTHTLQNESGVGKDVFVGEEAEVGNAVVEMMQVFGKGEGRDSQSNASIPAGTVAFDVATDTDDLAPTTVAFDVATDTDGLAPSTVAFDVASDTDGLEPTKPPKRATSVPVRSALHQSCRSRMGATQRRRRTWCSVQDLHVDHKDFLRTVRDREALVRPLTFLTSTALASQLAGKVSSQGRQLKHAETQTDAPWNQEVAELRMQWSLLKERCRALERQVRRAHPGQIL